MSETTKLMKMRRAVGDLGLMSGGAEWLPVIQRTKEFAIKKTPRDMRMARRTGGSECAANCEEGVESVVTLGIGAIAFT